MLAKVSLYTPADRFAESNRHRVAYHSADALERILAARLNERVAFGEGLKDGAFSQGKRSVLLGMAEAAVSEAVELSSYRGRRSVPFHPAIYARVGLSRIGFVALRY